MYVFGSTINTEEPYSVVAKNDKAILSAIANSSPMGGAFAEVGVYLGGTAWHLAKIARIRDVNLYLYDTFKGLPYCHTEKGDSLEVGMFEDTSAALVRSSIPDAIICEGIFPDTLVDMGPLSFVHCDCDQYEAINQTILKLYPILVPGGIMVFDDYYHLKGATDVVDEYFKNPRFTPGNKAVVFKGITELKKSI
jgi:hypothetical protein